MTKCHVKAGLQECMIDHVRKCKSFTVCTGLRQTYWICVQTSYTVSLYMELYVDDDLRPYRNEWPKWPWPPARWWKKLCDYTPVNDPWEWPPTCRTPVAALVTNDATEPNQTQHLFRIVHRQMEDRVLSDYFILTVFACLEGWSPKSPI